MLVRKIPALGGVVEYEASDGRRLVVRCTIDGCLGTWEHANPADRLHAAQRFGVANGPTWADDVLWHHQVTNRQIPTAFPGRRGDAYVWAHKQWPTEDAEALSIVARERFRRAEERWAELTRLL